MSFKGVGLGLSILAMSSGLYATSEQNTLRIMVKYKQDAKNLAALKDQAALWAHLPVKAITPMANGAYVLVLNTQSLKQDQNEDNILKALRQDPQVEYAVKDRVGHFKPVPNPQTSNKTLPVLGHETQWDEFSAPAGVMLESKAGLRDGAWAHTTGQAKKPVVVAVLDTGIALNDNLLNNLVKDSKGEVWGWNFAQNNDNLTDETESYHGTHVSGTIAGHGSVVLGMGEDLKVLTLKIPGENGMFYESSVINALYWSVGGKVPGVPNNLHPAKVLNMSFGVDLRPGKEMDYCDEALQEAIYYVRKKGAVLVAAAGNDNTWEHYNAPAVCNGVMRVASTGPAGLRSYFSNYGPGITLAAPGGDKSYGETGGILSTVNPEGGYRSSGFDFYQGTSMASRHVAGVAALVFAASTKTLKPQEVEQILFTTTHAFGKSKDADDSCVGKKPCGHGILDAQAAVKATLADYDQLFSAPSLSALEAKSCGNGKLVAEKNMVAAGDALWKLHDTSCQTEQNYQNPHIEKKADGSIYAYYGTTSYQLDVSKFSACEVIGFDGVGCYS